jgi:hypothetical protein
MSSTGAAQTMTRRKIDLGTVLKNAGTSFIDDIVPLLVATVIGIVLTVLTLGILAGPLYAGFISMFIRRKNEGRKPEIGDLFSQMHRFWAFFGAAVVLIVLIGLASITIIGGILLAAIWIYVFPLMVDRGIGLGEALRESREMVVRTGFWEHVVLILLLALVSALGRGWLVLLTAPFGAAIVAAGYLDGREEPAPRTPAQLIAG